METLRSRWPRILIVVAVLAAVSALLVGSTLLSWRRDRSAAVEFACDGTIASFKPEDVYNPPVLIVRNEDGTLVTLESRAIALTEREAISGARIVKQRNAPDAQINGVPLTFVRDP